MSKVKQYIKDFKKFAESKETFTLEDAIALIKMIYPNPVAKSFWDILKNKWSYFDYINKGITQLDIACDLLAGREPTKHYCKVCGKEVHAYNIHKGIPNTCSSACTLAYTKEQRISTTIQRHGGMGNASKSIKEKAASTNLKRYGSENPFASEEIKEQIKQTNIERYGVENAQQCEAIKEKTSATNIERYGAANVLNKNSSIRKKNDELFMEKYGSLCPQTSKEVKDKTKATLMEKYGVENHWQKYDKDGNVSILFQKMYEKRMRRSYELLFKLEDFEPMFTFEEWQGHKPSHEYEWKCKKCGNVFKWSINGASCLPRCLKCHPYSLSLAQQEIADYIRSIIDDSVIDNDRSVLDGGKEIDIWIPSRKIGIEFNGNYYHSRYDKDYHVGKTNLAESKGIHLLQIFEHEWLTKQSIVKHRIDMLFGKCKKLFARNCEIREVDSVQKAEFLNEYHLQGDAISKVNLGLYHNEELVALMTFGKPRFNKAYEWELVRYCAKCSIVGGAAKLLKHFETVHKPKSLLSYADRRWVFKCDNVYTRNGFVLDHEAEPGYFYSKNKFVVSRFNAQKKHLPKLLGDNFHEDLSESENMFVNGYIKLFDCGNLVYVKVYNCL